MDAIRDMQSLGLHLSSQSSGSPPGAFITRVCLEIGNTLTLELVSSI